MNLGVFCTFLLGIFISRSYGATVPTPVLLAVDSTTVYLNVTFLPPRASSWFGVGFCGATMSQVSDFLIFEYPTVPNQPVIIPCGPGASAYSDPWPTPGASNWTLLFADPPDASDPTVKQTLLLRRPRVVGTGFYCDITGSTGSSVSLIVAGGAMSGSVRQQHDEKAPISVNLLGSPDNATTTSSSVTATATPTLAQTLVPGSNGSVETQTPVPGSNGSVETQTPVPGSNGSVETQTPVPGSNGSVETQTPVPGSNGSVETQTPVPLNMSVPSIGTLTPFTATPARGTTLTPSASASLQSTESPEPTLTYVTPNYTLTSTVSYGPTETPPRIPAPVLDVASLLRFVIIVVLGSICGCCTFGIAVFVLYKKLKHRRKKHLAAAAEVFDSQWIPLEEFKVDSTPVHPEMRKKRGGTGGMLNTDVALRNAALTPSTLRAGKPVRLPPTLNTFGTNASASSRQPLSARVAMRARDA